MSFTVEFSAVVNATACHDRTRDPYPAPGIHYSRLKSIQNKFHLYKMSFSSWKTSLIPVSGGQCRLIISILSLICLVQRSLYVHNIILESHSPIHLFIHSFIKLYLVKIIVMVIFLLGEYIGTGILHQRDISIRHNYITT